HSPSLPLCSILESMEMKYGQAVSTMDTFTQHQHRQRGVNGPGKSISKKSQVSCPPAQVKVKKQLLCETPLAETCPLLWLLLFFFTWPGEAEDLIIPASLLPTATSALYAQMTETFWPGSTISQDQDQNRENANPRSLRYDGHRPIYSRQLLNWGLSSQMDLGSIKLTSKAGQGSGSPTLPPPHDDVILLKVLDTISVTLLRIYLESKLDRETDTNEHKRVILEHTKDWTLSVERK
ncbi:hypothetical protein STEG23_004836, partial [Scotinomys teguina]